MDSKAHQKAKEQGKTLGRWIEDAIGEKIARGEREETQIKWKRPVSAGLFQGN